MKVVLIPASSIGVLTKTLSMLEQKADRGGIPPKGAQSAAKRGLELRREFGRGGTMVGVARARDISNGSNLSESTVRRMKAYFDRHEVDKQGKDWDNAERPSNGKIAWLLWGGDAGRSWATSLVERWNREDGRTKSIPRWLPNGEEITEISEVAAVLNVDLKTAAWCIIDSKDAHSDLLAKAQRFVRTRSGAIHFGQPVGTPIRRDKESWRGMIAEAVSSGGGMTLSFMTGDQPKTGFVVAARGKNQEVPAEDFFDKKRGADAMMKWVRKHEKSLDKEGAHMGLWHDTDNNEVVLDVSYVVQNREEAEKLGRDNNQQAIWDIANMEEIDTGGTGDRKTLLEWINVGSNVSETTEAIFGNDGRGTKGLVREHNQSGTEVGTKDVFAADRTTGTPSGVSGSVAAPFEIMKSPVRRQTRERIRRILENWNTQQNRKEDENGS